MFQGECLLADSLLDDALLLNPILVAAYNFKCTVKYKTNRIKEAVAAWQKSIHLYDSQPKIQSLINSVSRSGVDYSVEEQSK